LGFNWDLGFGHCDFPVRFGIARREFSVALTGLDIYKKLPKTNCGDCGLPTCLAFAMKLAGGQAKLEACPHVSEQAKA